MADSNQLVDDGDDDIFVYYVGGDQVPRDVKRAKIDESIDTIPQRAFAGCTQLIEVVGHKKLKKIEAEAFYRCRRLSRLTKMGGVIEIEQHAFYGCTALSDLEFDKAEIIGRDAFDYCESLRFINMPSVRRIGEDVFWGCTALTEAVFSEGLERIEGVAFYKCTSLRRIGIPLKDGLIIEDRAFYDCDNLTRVDIVGGTHHKAISSLHMESWRNEMKEEIDRINQTIPDTPPGEKANAINQWITSVIDRMEHYKAEHQELLKEALALLELALWKAKLDEFKIEKVSSKDANTAKKIKIDMKAVRQEKRVTSAASVVIKNVLPFLELE